MPYHRGRLGSKEETNWGFEPLAQKIAHATERHLIDRAIVIPEMDEMSWGRIIDILTGLSAC